MAHAKTKHGSGKKSTSKAKTRYYVVQTVYEARNHLTGKFEDCNRKFIIQPLKNVKTFVENLKTEPRKNIVNLLDDGKTRITDLNKEAWNRVDGFAKDGNAFLTKAGKNPRETFNGLMDDGKEFVEDFRDSTREKIEDLTVDLKILREGIEKDTRLVLADIIDGSKKAFGHMPGKQWIENAISDRLEALPAKFNLPSRKDVERLTRQVKTLNTKVNKLSKTSTV